VGRFDSRTTDPDVPFVGRQLSRAGVTHRINNAPLHAVLDEAGSERRQLFRTRKDGKRTTGSPGAGTG